MLSRMMNIETAHFGCLGVDIEDAIRFPLGLPGLENRCRWVLLTPPGDSAVSWLQSVECPATALAVVDPCRFVADYQLRTPRQGLDDLKLHSLDDARVLVTVNRTQKGLAIDLKAPLVINSRLRIGRQLIANGDMPMRHLLEDVSRQTARKIA